MEYGQPLTINCRLFSKFIVSTLSHQHVRISNAHLEPPDAESSGLKILACSSSKRGIIASTSRSGLDNGDLTIFQTVTPAQPAQFLFQINSEGPGEQLYVFMQRRLFNLVYL